MQLDPTGIWIDPGPIEESDTPSGVSRESVSSGLEFDAENAGIDRSAELELVEPAQVPEDAAEISQQDPELPILRLEGLEPELLRPGLIEQDESLKRFLE